MASECPQFKKAEAGSICEVRELKLSTCTSSVQVCGYVNEVGIESSLAPIQWLLSSYSNHLTR